MSAIGRELGTATQKNRQECREARSIEFRGAPNVSQECLII